MIIDGVNLVQMNTPTLVSTYGELEAKLNQ